MYKNFQRRQVLQFAGVSVAVAHGWASAQPFPFRPVRIIAPYAAGGSLDIVARLLAQKLGASTGQSFIVENRAGASGNIGAELVVRSVPDGYTLAILPDSNLTANPYLFAGMSFNPQKDLMPISMLTTIGIGLVVNPSIPATSVPELLAFAKASSGGLSYGTPGSGTPHHLAGELLKQMSGANLVHVPYKGGSPAMLDVIGNQIPCAFVALAVAAPHVRTGKLRLLGVTQATRSSLFPDTPSLGESMKGYEFTSWIGLFAPVGTPPDIVERLNAEIKRALTEPATAKILSEQALDVRVSTPSELKERIHTESSRLSELIRTNRISTQ
jgi:tripartite-type tricarboxylate transporter receptor subunit TctC